MPKSGKTTIATKFPNHLILAFEKGYSAIPGAMAQPINSWGEFKKTLRELKDPAVKEKFETVIIDTCDIAYDYCTKYICSNNGVDTIREIPYGGGYSLVSREFDESLRSIVQMDYGLVLISHATDKTFTDEAGGEYSKIVPTLDKRANNIVARMADIIGYARPVTIGENQTQTRLFMRGTNRFEAGSRFKYTPDSIEFTYKNLVAAISDAIDKQAAEDGDDLFTDQRQNAYETSAVTLDFDSLMSQFKECITSIPGYNLAQEGGHEEEDVVVKFTTYWAPRITEITDRYLGKGKKVGNIDRSQVEQLDLIVTDLRSLVAEAKTE